MLFTYGDLFVFCLIVAVGVLCFWWVVLWVECVYLSWGVLLVGLVYFCDCRIL